MEAAGKVPPKDGPCWWSGKGELAVPPKIGDRVVVKVNEIGPGIVTGYFTEYGWLGVYVRPESPPAWWVKQNFGDGATEKQKEHAAKGAMVFGVEISAAGAGK